jgi:hypothetical protein
MAIIPVVSGPTGLVKRGDLRVRDSSGMIRDFHVTGALWTVWTLDLSLTGPWEIANVDPVHRFGSQSK